jgi:hypothetical protein
LLALVLGLGMFSQAQAGLLGDVVFGGEYFPTLSTQVIDFGSAVVDNTVEFPIANMDPEFQIFEVDFSDTQMTLTFVIDGQFGGPVAQNGPVFWDSTNPFNFASVNGATTAN